MKEKEKKFNDNTLNEFSNAIAEFLKKYDTKKNNAHIFCVIAEEDGEEVNAITHTKGVPLQIAAAVNNAVESNEKLKTASFVNSLLSLNKMKSDNKDKIIGALDFLKELTK